MPNPFRLASSQPLRPCGTSLPQIGYENGATNPSHNTALNRTAEIAAQNRVASREKWDTAVSSPESTSSSLQTQGTPSGMNSPITVNEHPSPSIRREVILSGYYGKARNATLIAYPVFPYKRQTTPSKLNPRAPPFRSTSCAIQSQPEPAKKNSHLATSSESTLTTQTLPSIDTSPRTQPPETRPLPPPQLSQQRGLSWPPFQPVLRNKRYNCLHPLYIPDATFLTDPKAGTSWHYLRNVFENNIFNPSHTPWWTHWFIAFTHIYTRQHSASRDENGGGGGWTQQEICEAYKWRYGDSVPGIDQMTVVHEDELFAWLVCEKRDYAFEWEGDREEDLRSEVDRCVRAAARGGAN